MTSSRNRLWKLRSSDRALEHCLGLKWQGTDLFPELLPEFKDQETIYWYNDFTCDRILYTCLFVWFYRSKIENVDFPRAKGPCPLYSRVAWAHRKSCCKKMQRRAWRRWFKAKPLFGSWQTASVCLWKPSQRNGVRAFGRYGSILLC